MTQCLICRSDYARTSNRQKWCVSCTAQARLEYRKTYVVENRDQVLATSRRVSRAWGEKNKALKSERDRAYREKNRDSLLAKRRTPEYRAKAAARLRTKYAADEGKRIHNRMASAVYQAMKGGKAGRKWETLVGYTLADLVSHLERQFPKGMTWQNMGQWHIDHIRPKKDFDQTDPVQFRECWGLLNLRPLWAPANQAKAGRREHLL